MRFCVQSVCGKVYIAYKVYSQFPITLSFLICSVCVCPQVYAVGGYDGQSRLSSVECYDSFSNRWTEVAPMKEAVSSPAVASCAGKLFVIGGGPDDDTCSDKVGNRCVPPARPHI